MKHQRQTKGGFQGLNKVLPRFRSVRNGEELVRPGWDRGLSAKDLG